MNFRILKNIFFLILCIILVQNIACSNANPPEEAPEAVKSDQISLLPVETNILIYANFEELKKSPLGDDVKDEFKKIWEEDKDEEYQEFVEKTGLNLEEDIYEVWIGGIAADHGDGYGGILVKGKFNQDKIADYIKEKNDKDVYEENYKGYKLYISEDDDDTNLTFLGKNLAVVGKEKWLKTIIDQTKTHEKSVLDNTIMAKHLKEIEQKNHCWGIFNLEELSEEWAKKVRENSKFKGTESIENMKSVYFYTHFDNKTDVYVKGTFATEKEADLIAEMLTGFKAMAKLLVSDDREAVDLLNDIEIRTKGSVVEITTKVDKNFFDKLKEKRASFSEGRVKLL